MVPQEYTELLREFVSLKSISTDAAYKDDVRKTAEWLSHLLSSYGFKTELIPGEKTNPTVFASLEVDPAAETILVYGHYDVQPASKEDGWESDPFTLTERDGRIFARGAIDNKGQVLIHIYTIGKLAKEGNLKYNIKFLIEGNEETGNEELGEIVQKDAVKFACDYVVISDGETVQDRPTIDVGLRGGMNLTLKYKTANTNLHSGIYGGAVPSAPMEAIKLISKFYDADNKVAIPGFYDGAVLPTPAEIENNKGVEFTDETLKELTGAKKLRTEAEYDFYTQTGLRPMLTVTGFKSGYINEGYANIVPAEAEIKINFRFVVDQDPDKVYAAFEKFVSENTPDYVDWSIDKNSSWGAIKINIDQPKVQEVIDLLEKSYDAKVFKKFVGGSVPIVMDFKNALGKDTISISMANEDCNMHGANENFKLDLAEKGLKFSEAFFSKS